MKNILEREIVWKLHPYHLGYNIFIENEIIYLLRLNNWHDEIAYTVICGIEILDLDLLPTNWKIINPT